MKFSSRKIGWIFFPLKYEFLSCEKCLNHQISGFQRADIFLIMTILNRKDPLRIFQRFRLVKFIEKFQTRVKILKIEESIAFDKYLHELFFAFYFHLSKYLFLMLKIMNLLI